MVGIRKVIRIRYVPIVRTSDYDFYIGRGRKSRREARAAVKKMRKKMRKKYPRKKLASLVIRENKVRNLYGKRI